MFGSVKTHQIVLCGGRQDGEVLRWQGEVPPFVEVPTDAETLTYDATDSLDRYGSRRYVLRP